MFLRNGSAALTSSSEAVELRVGGIIPASPGSTPLMASSHMTASPCSWPTSRPTSIRAWKMFKNPLAAYRPSIDTFGWKGPATNTADAVKYERAQFCGLFGDLFRQESTDFLVRNGNTLADEIIFKR